MRYLARIRSEPSLWLLFATIAAVAASILYMVLGSITY
jgi:hypothetical protein